MGRGLLIVGHGTREASGVAEFSHLVAQVSEALPDHLVEPAMLELAEPPISSAMRRLVDRGADEVVVVPMMLLAAAHVIRDIPAQIEAASRAYEGLDVTMAAHLGCQEPILQLSELRYRQAAGGLEREAAEQTLLLIVGRGSNCPEAGAEMCRFARLRWERTPTAWLEVCFAAMSRPSLQRALPIVAEMPFERIVVQPHLLFRGQLLNQIRNQVAEAALRWPARQWIVTQHLGPHQLLVDAVCDLAEGAATASQGVRIARHGR